MANFKLGLGDEKIDRTNLILGIFVFFFAFIVYLMTVQRTLSFWDCGEFVASSFILGIPHPPGTPLFVIIGRIFSMLPTSSDIGFRINIASVLFSAMAAMFGYFCIVKIVKDWFVGELNDIKRVGIYAGGIIGGLCMAFSNTNWGSAIEAEVYAAAMFLITFIIWVALCWAENREKPGSERYIILISFLITLSLAIHPTVYLIMPMVYLMFLLLSERLRREWTFWVTGIVLVIQIVSITYFIFCAVAWLAICIVVYSSTRARSWILPLYMSFAAVGGFSVHLYIPIRSDERPAINENAPSTWGSFKGYLERKQYGNKSMVERMFARRGTWGNQFGNHERMGFWGFFQKQYGVRGLTFLFTLFPMGLIGLVEMVNRRWGKGIPFFLMVLAGTVGLVIYMNFADGTMEGKFPDDDAHLEVRDRDYFWQPGFILFGLAIGIGFSALWDMVYVALQRKGNLQRGVYAMLVLLVIPIISLRANWFENNRNLNKIPYDYAYNLLISADPNAVVFTNGDNDTFPVWALQQVYGIRKDVRIANLSLLNTDWYIKQLKNDMGVPISLTDKQIEDLRHYKTPDGKFSRIQDQMIDNIIETSNFKVPVHFAVTVSDDNRMYRGEPIDDHLEMHGMMYRVKKESGKDMIDIDGTTKLYMEDFQYRGVSDTTIYKDENQERLTNNYAAGFLYTAEMARKQGKIQDAVALMKKSISVVPGQMQSYGYLAQVYADMDSVDKIQSIFETAPKNVDLKPVWLTLANDYWTRKKDKTRAGEILNRMLDEDHNYKTAFQQLISYFYQDKMYDSIGAAVTRWIAFHPDDAEAKGILSELDNMRAQDTSKIGVHVKKVETPRDSH